jgi:hypothetical protein
MFTDPGWKRIARYIYFKEMDGGEKIAVVLATMSPNRDDFLLNKGEFERVLNGKRDGRVDHTFVVAAKLARPCEYQGAEFAEALAARLANRPTIDGIYGEFWALQLYDIDNSTPL